MQAWAVAAVIRTREWILSPFKDQCRRSLDVATNENLLHSLLCCDSPFSPGHSCCKLYVKAFALWSLSACSSMWENLVTVWFSIWKLDDLQPRLKGAGNIHGGCCWLRVSNVLVHTLISWWHCQSLSKLLQYAVVQEWTICKDWPVTGPGISLPLVGRISLFIS